MALSFRSLILSSIILFVVLSGCTKKGGDDQKLAVTERAAVAEVPKPQEKPFEYCSDHMICSEFREYEGRCRTKQAEDDCKKFVRLFEKLAVKNDCMRKFDTAPVPSVWICDEDAEESSYPKLFERSAATLSKLKYSFARKFYGSNAFRSTLDGEVAEEHLEKSMKIKN